MRSDLIVIIGPTASGKSALAVRLAKKFNGEVISADSRQVYRGLEIGSGAITKKQAAGIPHHLLGIASPRQTFTAAEFKRRAIIAIAMIRRRRKIPILVGGTAFWIDALVYGLNLPAAKPDSALRRRLDKKSPAQLLTMLKKLDPRRAAVIEQKNPRRLIRAIEIAKAIGKTPNIRRRSPYRTLWLGLKLSYETGPGRIKQRVKSIVRRGLVPETRQLLGAGVSKKRIREFGFEYRAALDFIERRIRPDQLPEHIVRDTLAYAKRQMNWWKRNPEINWVGDHAKAAHIIKKFLQKTE